MASRLALVLRAGSRSFLFSGSVLAGRIDARNLMRFPALMVQNPSKASLMEAKELVSRSMLHNNRKYFIDLKVSDNGDRFVKISEVNLSSRKRSSVFVALPDMAQVMKQVDGAGDREPDGVPYASFVSEGSLGKREYSFFVGRTSIGTSIEIRDRILESDKQMRIYVDLDVLPSFKATLRDVCASAASIS